MANSTPSGATELAATPRAETGKGASRRARREGRIPAVLYGHGTDPQHLELDAHDYAAVLRYNGTNAVLTLNVGGTQQLALTKALDLHPLRRNIQHVDLLVVRRGEKVTVEVPVAVEGEPEPGSLVTQETGAIEVLAEALSIPEQLTVSVSGVDAGTQFPAGQVALPAGVELVSDPELLVVNVVAAPTAAQLEATETAAPADAEAPAAVGEEPEAE